MNPTYLRSPGSHRDEIARWYVRDHHGTLHRLPASTCDFMERRYNLDAPTRGPLQEVIPSQVERLADRTFSFDDIVPVAAAVILALVGIRIALAALGIV